MNFIKKSKLKIVASIIIIIDALSRFLGRIESHWSLWNLIKTDSVTTTENINNFNNEEMLILLQNYSQNSLWSEMVTSLLLYVFIIYLVYLYNKTLKDNKRTRMLAQINHWLNNIRFHDIRNNKIDELMNIKLERQKLKIKLEQKYPDKTIKQIKEILEIYYTQKEFFKEDEHNRNNK